MKNLLICLLMVLTVSLSAQPIRPPIEVRPGNSSIQMVTNFVAGYRVVSITATGGGSGGTNSAPPVYTNWVANTLYSNNSAAAWTVQSGISVITTGVVGRASIGLVILGSTTNTITVGPGTTALTEVKTNNLLISAAVASGQGFYFTNNSITGPNSGSLVAGTGFYQQNGGTNGATGATGATGSTGANGANGTNSPTQWKWLILGDSHDSDFLTGSEGAGLWTRLMGYNQFTNRVGLNNQSITGQTLSNHLNSILDTTNSQLPNVPDTNWQVFIPAAINDIISGYGIAATTNLLTNVVMRLKAAGVVSNNIFVATLYGATGSGGTDTILTNYNTFLIAYAAAANLGLLRLDLVVTNAANTYDNLHPNAVSMTNLANYVSTNVSPLPVLVRNPGQTFGGYVEFHGNKDWPWSAYFAKPVYGPLIIRSRDNSVATDIFTIQSLNQSEGVAFGYESIRQTHATASLTISNRVGARLVLGPSGLVGIGTNTPGTELEAVGTIQASGSSATLRVTDRANGARADSWYLISGTNFFYNGTYNFLSIDEQGNMVTTGRVFTGGIVSNNPNSTNQLLGSTYFPIPTGTKTNASFDPVTGKLVGVDAPAGSGSQTNDNTKASLSGTTNGTFTTPTLVGTVLLQGVTVPVIQPMLAGNTMNGSNLVWSFTLTNDLSLNASGLSNHVVYSLIVTNTNTFKITAFTNVNRFLGTTNLEPTAVTKISVWRDDGFTWAVNLNDTNTPAMLSDLLGTNTILAANLVSATNVTLARSVTYGNTNAVLGNASISAANALLINQPMLDYSALTGAVNYASLPAFALWPGQGTSASAVTNTPTAGGLVYGYSLSATVTNTIQGQVPLGQNYDGQGIYLSVEATWAGFAAGGTNNSAAWTNILGGRISTIGTAYGAPIFSTNKFVTAATADGTTNVVIGPITPAGSPKAGQTVLFSVSTLTNAPFGRTNGLLITKVDVLWLKRTNQITQAGAQ